VPEPKLTAILPVKRYHPEYLRRAVGSMLGQTSPHWRLSVVVDELPLDGLGTLLAPALRDRRVDVVLNEGRGLAGAINSGMRRAETDYTAILLGDDMWAPHAVEVLSRRIRRMPVDFFHSSRVIVDGRDRPISNVYPAIERFTLDHFVRYSPVKHLLCWRRDTGLAIGGLDERSRSVGPDDYDFPWSMAEAGASFAAVQDCLYLYRDHRDSFRLTTHLPRSTHAGELRRILRKHGVGRIRTELAIVHARRTYLRQCLYRNELHRRFKEWVGHDPRAGWRASYE
jgi:GT2 family glycosyltransferase